MFSSDSNQPSCCSASPPLNPKIIWLFAALSAVCAVSYVFEPLVPFREHLLMYLSKVWWAVLLGIFLGGLIDHYVSREYISFQLAGDSHHSIWKSVGLGFLMSACCHGILAISMQLYRKGASTSSVVAFLLASPWANLTWTIFLIGFFGWIKALYIVGVSVVIAMVTGFIFQQLEKASRVERNPNTAAREATSGSPRFWNFLKGRIWSAADIAADVKGVTSGILVLSNMVLLWALIGVTFAAAIGAYVPAHIFQQYMGPSVAGMLITLGLAVVIEVCSEGSAPIAFEIYRQTGALGNSLVFLLAGVATDYTEIGILWQNIGRRTALWLPAITVPQILFWGWIANVIF